MAMISNILRIDRLLITGGSLALVTIGAFAIPGCAHFGSRAPASGEKMQVTSESAVNKHGKIGRYDLSLEGHYPIDGDADFAAVVEVFRGVKISTEIGNQLAAHKNRPLKYLQSFETFGKPSDANGRDLTYIIRSVPQGHDKYTSWTKFDCTDTYTKAPGRGYWHQDCVADFNYQQTRKYLSDFHQVSTCTQSEGVADCSIVTNGVSEPVHIDVGFIAKEALKLLFGASDASATQAAHYAVKSQMHAFYAASALLKMRPPYFTATGGVDTARVHDAIEIYVQNEFNAVESADNAPSSMDDTSSALVMGPTEH